MIPITKSPTKDKIDKNIMALIIVHYKILKKIKLEKIAFIAGDFRFPHQD